MPSPAAPTTSPPGATRRYWLIAIAAGALAVGKLALVLAQGGPNTDLRAYTAAAANLRSGAPIYWLPIVQGGDPPNYLYPPFLALVFTLLGPYRTAWWIWGLFSIACWLGALALLLRALREPLGRRLGPRGWPLLVAGLAVFPPVTAHILWGQVGLPILLCLTAAWWALGRRRDGLAGALIGLAIALKIYPALVLVPLVARGRWRAVLVSGAAAALLIGGGFLFVGWEQTRLYLGEVLPAAGDHGVGDVGNYALRERIGQPLFAVTAVAALGALAWAGRRGELSQAYALAASAILLLSPVVWGHYFVLALLPWLLAVAVASRRQLVALVVAILLVATASAVFYVPLFLVPLAQAAPTVGVVILFAVQLAQATRAPGA